MLLLRRARGLLDAVSTLTGEHGVTWCGTDLRRTGESLRAAERLVLHRIRHGAGAGDELAVVLLQLGDARAACEDLEMARRSAAVTDVREALRRLRPARSVAELVELVPPVVHRLGFNRVLLSRMCGPSWIARSGFVARDATMADAMVRIGAAAPGRTERGWPEADVVLRRTPVLVHDAQCNPRVHPELKALMSTRDYVAAPLVAQGEVIGLLHADQSVTADALTELDRDLLGLFAEGLGFAFERTICQDQLVALRDRLEEQARSVADLIDGLGEADVLGPDRPPVTPRPSYVVSGPLAELTRRELEVLRHLADGASNDQIAARLFISAGTVKTHVKHLLHKLGAANRAEAVSRYHHLTR